MSPLTQLLLSVVSVLSSCIYRLEPPVSYTGLHIVMRAGSSGSSGIARIFFFFGGGRGGVVCTTHRLALYTMGRSGLSLAHVLGINYLVF